MSRVSEIREEAKKQEILLIKAKIQDVLEAAKAGKELTGEDYELSFYEVSKVVSELYNQGLEEGKDFVLINGDTENQSEQNYQIVLKVDGKYLSLSADNVRMGARDGSNVEPRVSDEFTEENLDIYTYDDVDEVLRKIERLEQIDLDKVLFPELEHSNIKDDTEISSEGTIDERIVRKNIEIRELEAKLATMRQERNALIRKKSAIELLKNIKEGNFVDPEELEDGVSSPPGFEQLKVLEEVYHRYGEEYIFPTGYEALDEDETGYVRAGMIMKINGKYVVDGVFRFDTIEEILEFNDSYRGQGHEFKDKDIFKLKLLKDITPEELEDLIEGRTISEKSIPKRTRFEQALLRDDVIDYFLDKSPEEIEAMFGTNVAKMVGFDQNNPHHCYDLFEHSLNAVAGINTDGLSKKDAIKLKVAAFFHDLGKPQVAMEKNGNTVFYGHAKKSAEMAREVLGGLDYEPEEIEQLLFLIEHHDDFINFKREDEEWNRKNPFFRGINLENVARKIQEAKEDATIYNQYNPSKKDYQLLLRLCVADANAQSRIVRNNGRVVDSRANKVSRLSQVEELIPEAYDLSIEKSAEVIKKWGRYRPQNEEYIGKEIDNRVKGVTNMWGDIGKLSIEIDEDIRGYVQAITDTYIHDGLPNDETQRVIDELSAKGMTSEQYSRVEQVLVRINTNRIKGGINEVHKSGRLTELFDVKKALIARNADAERLLEQYERSQAELRTREDN